LIRAKKKFGQNFLKDESVLVRIIQSKPKDALTVAEIGPGLGDLTQKLLAHCERVVAFEIDLELCAVLQDKFHDELSAKQLTLVCDDVLEAWGEKSLLDEPYHLVANLPYYVATRIILKALADNNCRSILVMIQKEVAVKFASRVEEKTFSSLAILAQSIAKAELLFDVGAECFDPAPKVTSAVLKLTKFTEFVHDDAHEGLFDSPQEYKAFQTFLKAAFVAPRKTLYKNLQQTALKEAIMMSFETLQLVQNIRPHQLSISKYHLLFKNLK
jgi:16S rRNA (adenine1518-N6/adenine1519-N6)-dimethyltransferase